jgi:twitching motility protein PilT
MNSRVDAFLELAVRQGGSDLHLVSGYPPRIRVHGELQRVRFRELSAEDMERLIFEIMTEGERNEFGEQLSIDFAHDAGELGRFRVNAYRHLSGMAAAFRVIPTSKRKLADLDLPAKVGELVQMPHGLVLVTGPTGSGKSTTLAALVDHINNTRKGHIITIEDPIEFLHKYQKCVVTQREVGLHSISFAEALRNALREDPDMILVGEMRDLETISLALTAAETGVQVLGTLHTQGAVRTIDRITSAFPANRREQVRNMLADGLRMVISQELVRKATNDGLVMVAEVLVNTPAVASLVRTAKTNQLPAAIQAGGRDGMQSLDTKLRQLVSTGAVSAEEAYRHAIDKALFERRDPDGPRKAA